MPHHGCVRPRSASSGSRAFNAFMLINARMGWLTLKVALTANPLRINNREVALALQGRCPGDHEHSWIIRGRKISGPAAIYPSGLVNAILQAYGRSVNQLVHELHYVKAKEIVEYDLQKNRNYFGQSELTNSNPVWELGVMIHWSWRSWLGILQRDHC